MKVRIGREELLTGLQRVQGVVEKRNTMPILSNILLEAKHEGAEIVATDLEIGMRGLYKATVLEAGGVTISARKLYEIIKELPNSEIELTSGDNNWTAIRLHSEPPVLLWLPHNPDYSRRVSSHLAQRSPSRRWPYPWKARTLVARRSPTDLD